MNISFDFDGTLDNDILRKLILYLSTHVDNKIYILTSRNPDGNNKDLYEFIKHLIIEEVIFAYKETKVSKIIQYKIDIHFDDDEIDVKQINHETGKNIAVLVNMNW